MTQPTKKNKELILSITSKDLDVTYYKGGVGAGGQKLQKTSSACRITHLPSGAVGDCKSHRSQAQNKKEALKRLTESKKFKAWLRLEVAARMQGYRNTEEKIDEMMRPENMKVEAMENGKWTELP